MGVGRLAVVAVAVGALVGAAGIRTASAAAYAATNDEYALLVLTNELRADPAAQGVTASVAAPLVWSDGLGQAARVHSEDMAENGCYQHNSCGGGSWSSRIGQFYPGWEWLAENICGLAVTPDQIFSVWVHSDGHRSNMLNGAFVDYGEGVAVGDDDVPFATADFGNRALRALGTIPAIPAGAVLPRIGGSESRELIANYYHYNGQTPRSVRVRVGSSCVTLSRKSGTPSWGTWSTTRGLSGNGCLPVVFEAVRSDGKLYRFPESDSLVVGVGAAGANCPERTTTAPAATCGNDTQPSPTPTPAPTPGSGTASIDDVKLVVRPGPAGKSKSQVSLQAVLTPSAPFDPSTAGVSITIKLPGGVTYVRDLPETCDDAPCLRSSAKGTSFRGHYDLPGVSLSFGKTKTGTWRVHFGSSRETLSDLASGNVTVTVSAGGITASRTLVGVMGRKSLTAN